MNLLTKPSSGRAKGAPLMVVVMVLQFIKTWGCMMDVKAKEVSVNLPFGIGGVTFVANETEQNAAWEVTVQRPLDRSPSLWLRISPSSAPTELQNSCP